MDRKSRQQSDKIFLNNVTCIETLIYLYKLYTVITRALPNLRSLKTEHLCESASASKDRGITYTVSVSIPDAARN